MGTSRQRKIIVIVTIGLLILVSLVPMRVYAQEGKHVVSPGENLFRIALRYGVTVEALAAINNIPNTAIVYAGQVLTIPTAASPAPQTQPAAPVSPAPVAVAASHTVAPGDTLNKIARQYGVSLETLLAANSLPDPNRILIGQSIIIPGQGGAAAAPNPVPAAGSEKPAEVAKPAATGSERTHVVARGEGLARIAAQYSTTWQAIASFNNIPNPDLIYAGMVLKIPPADYQPSMGPDPSFVPEAPVTTGKLILVVLREQRVYVYQDGKLLRSVRVSTGLPGTPTVTGTYRIYLKYKSQTMSGPGYYLPNVPYVMYFYQGYGLHGTYWHNNFGRPMSHGCVNMPTPEAGWLYNWAEIGTPVHVRW